VANFFWNNQEGEKKYHLANWQLIAQKKEYGGMGVPDLQQLNLCLLASWISRYHLNKEAVWRKIVDSKYNINDPNIFCSSDSKISPLWKGVLWACKAAKMGYTWKVGDGKSIRF
jgi:hypothetical protein